MNKSISFIIIRLVILFMILFSYNYFEIYNKLGSLLGFGCLLIIMVLVSILLEKVYYKFSNKKD